MENNTSLPIQAREVHYCDQTRAVALGFDCNALEVLSFLLEFYNSGSMDKVEIDDIAPGGLQWCRINKGYIVEQCPCAASSEKAVRRILGLLAGENPKTGGKYPIELRAVKLSENAILAFRPVPEAVQWLIPEHPEHKGKDNRTITDKFTPKKILKGHLQKNYKRTIPESKAVAIVSEPIVNETEASAEGGRDKIVILPEIKPEHNKDSRRVLASIEDSWNYGKSNEAEILSIIDTILDGTFIGKYGIKHRYKFEPIYWKDLVNILKDYRTSGFYLFDLKTFFIGNEKKQASMFIQFYENRKPIPVACAMEA